MSLFRLLAYASPLLLGFGVAAALALTARRPAKHRAIATGGVVAALLLLLLLTSFSESPKYCGPLAAVLVSWSLLVAGIYMAAETAKVPRDLCQILAGLGACFLMSTLFWMGPLIRAAADRGAAGDAIYRRITLSMDVNPFFVIAYGVFDTDLLRVPFFYRMGMADFQHGTPSWGISSGGFAVAGLVFGLAALAGRRRSRPAAP